MSIVGENLRLSVPSRLSSDESSVDQVTAELIDTIMESLEVALEKMVEAQGFPVKLRKAELDFLHSLEHIRDSILLVLENPLPGRARLKTLFGGECDRIAELRALIDSAEFSDMNRGDQRLPLAISVCESVEKVLGDLGLSGALQAAKSRQHQRILRCITGHAAKAVASSTPTGFVDCQNISMADCFLSKNMTGNIVQQLLKDKVIVVTGCTKGIGRAMFEWYAQRSNSVAGCGTDDDDLKTLLDEYPLVMARKVDVQDEDAVAKWLEDIEKDLGPIDILVCAAGLAHAPAPAWEIAAEDWQRVLEVNVVGQARVLRHAVTKLQKPGATVVLMSSRYGRSVAPGQGCYATSKWATEGLAKSLALDLLGDQVAVVSLDPGSVNTNMLRVTSGGDEEFCAQQKTPDDCARIAAPFILSLSLEDTGRSLVCPGCPEHHFQSGVPYKDRPAWASGLGPFVRASEDGSAAKKKDLTRYFISGALLSNDGSKTLVSQDYRKEIAEIVQSVDKRATIVDPLDRLKEVAETMDSTAVDVLLGNSAHEGCNFFHQGLDLAKSCDVVLGYIPEPSMAVAVLLWEARTAGRLILTVSPIGTDWMLSSVTDKNFVDLDDLRTNLHAYLPN